MNRLILGLILVTLLGRAAGAQVLRGDSAVLKRIAKDNPCPHVVPDAWRASDTSLGTGLRCSLVAAAAAAVRRGIASHALPFLDLDDLVCVRVVSFAFRDVRTKRIVDPYWSVEFCAATRPWARAIVHRESGKIDVTQVGDEFGVGAKKMCAGGTPRASVGGGSELVREARAPASSVPGV